MSSSSPPSVPAAAAASALRLPRRAFASEGWQRTFSSLSNDNFRLLWVSMLFSFTSLHMSFTAQGFLTYELTGTAKSLGLVGLGWGIPQLAFSLVGGVAADRLHKRWLVVFSMLVMAVTSLVTAVLIQTDVINVWQIFGLALVSGTVFAFFVPARQAWIPELVSQEQLMNAVALNSSAFTAMSIVGPGLAGALIAVPFIGLTGVYYLMAASYAVAVLLLARIPGGGPVAGRTYVHPYRSMMDGLRYVRRHPVLPVLLVMGFVPIVVGMPYRTLFPVFAREVYGVGSVGLGVMGLATGLGALVGSLGVASLAPGSRRSAIQVVAGLGFGVTLIAFAAAPALALGLLALLFVGLMSNSYWALNGTMVLASSDPEYYGRVQSIYMLSWSVQAFAGLPIGALADLLGVQTTVAGVGVTLVVALAAIVALFPGHRRLREHEANRVQPARAQ